MISNSKLSNQIIEKAKSLGASVAGIASVESLKSSPSHQIYPKIGMNLNAHVADTKDDRFDAVAWPEDAVSAVVIGVAHGADKPELDWWDGRGTPGNRILIQINRQLSQWIETTFDIKTYKLPYLIEKGGIFLKDAAVNAGLGAIGKNNLVISPEYGPRIRFRALLLNKEAKASHCPEFNPCEGCGEPCRKACPVNAFQNTVYSPKALGQSILPGIDGTYDRITCNTKMGKDIENAARQITADDNRQRALRQWVDAFESDQINLLSSDQRLCVKYCRRCELSCPVGN